MAIRNEVGRVRQARICNTIVALAVGAVLLYAVVLNEARSAKRRQISAEVRAFARTREAIEALHAVGDSNCISLVAELLASSRLETQSHELARRVIKVPEDIGDRQLAEWVISNQGCFVFDDEWRQFFVPVAR
jgi:hypothetical protein